MSTPTATEQSTEAVYVGQPATITLYSDTVAAVVVKVNAKSFVVASVPTDSENRRQTNPGEPFPCWVEDGIVDAPAERRGAPERFTTRTREDGSAYGSHGSIKCILGRSISKTDYRY